MRAFALSHCARDHARSSFVNLARWLRGFNVNQPQRFNHKADLKAQASRQRHDCADGCSAFAKLARRIIIKFDVKTECPRFSSASQASGVGFRGEHHVFFADPHSH
jgi:hypothetical protein